MSEEEWQDLRGWDGKYQISNHGRLRSFGIKFSRLCPGGYITVGCHEKSTGYNAVTLRRPGFIEKNRIHVLVATHFIIKPFSYKNLCVNHKDGNKKNNHVENLEWVTFRENSQHAVNTGLHNLKGENHPHAKLTRDKVIEMRKLRKQGLTHQKIADMYGISRRQAGDVITGRNWGWLTNSI